MNWFMHRLQEPSTRIGLGIFVATALGVSNNPPSSTAQWFTVASTFLGALAGIATKAPGSADNPVPVPVAVETVKPG